MPRASSSAASEAEAMPLPNEDTTPPVTKMYLVMNSVRLRVLLESGTRFPGRAPNGDAGYQNQAVYTMKNRMLAGFFGCTDGARKRLPDDFQPFFAVSRQVWCAHPAICDCRQFMVHIKQRQARAHPRRHTLGLQ